MVRRNFKSAFSNSIDVRSGAPETFRSHVKTESSPLQVTNEVDIWSIGCVFSEVSVWAHYGWKRVDEYRRQRSAEIEAQGGAVGEHVFHFDGKLLDAVNNIHQDMLGKPTVQHKITRSVLDRLVVDMLQHGSRPHAKFVFERSKRLVEDCEKAFGVSIIELGGSAGGELTDSDEARTRTRSLRQVPHGYHRSAGGNSPVEEPLPADDRFTPSSSSSRSQSPPHRHHHKSASQTSKRRSIRATESPQSGEQASHVVPNPPPPPPTAANSYRRPPQQHVQELQEGPVRPTLSIDEGHAWKKQKKDGGIAILPGGENLTSLDKRDHVSHVLSKPNLANGWL